jgi:protease-4
MELKKNKPVVASVGGMAASGGYYIACAAHKIVAEQSSILGSIGVVMGKFAVDDALAKYGVHVTIVPAKAGAGARAAYGSALVPWDDATRAKLSRSMKQTYQLFVERVAEARGMAVADITPAAEGRIMGGADAKALGLADEIGGLTRAIQLAAELAKIDAATPVHVQSPPSSLLEILGDAELGERRRALVERQRRDHALQLLFGPVATGMLRDELLAFAALLGPIAEGEHVLAAAPFALSIK